MIAVCDMGPLHYLAIWTLEVLDEAAERGLINDLSERLEHLELRTTFYVGERARAVIEEMKQRDLQRKQS